MSTDRRRPASSEGGADYDAFARQVMQRGILTDPWLHGQPRLGTDPVVVKRELARKLYRAAEEIAATYHALCLIVSDEPCLLEEFFAMTPYQRAMWQGSRPLWHGLARVDLFQTAEGLVMSEINCDTRTGEAEAVELGALGIDGAGGRGLFDPSARLGARFAELLETFATRDLLLRAPTAPLHVGIVYPTEFTEDLSLVRLYRSWVESAGHRVTLGSPYNLGFDGERTTLFGDAVDVIVRHYKTDWWGERESVWTSEEVSDRRPLDGPLRAVMAGMAEGRVTVINPFGSVLTQNKRAMAFMWEHIHRFPLEAQATIQRYVPVSARLETVHSELLLAGREDWVLKSDYGAEGEEVIVGGMVSDATWRETISEARVGRWIAQRYFEADTTEAGETTNLGVFLVAGAACGIFARMQAGPTDGTAKSRGVLFEVEEA